MCSATGYKISQWYDELRHHHHHHHHHHHLQGERHLLGHVNSGPMQEKSVWVWNMNPGNCLFSQWGAASSRWCHGRASCTHSLASNPRSSSRPGLGPVCQEATDWGDKLWCILLQELNSLASTVCRCAVQLKQVGLRVTGNVTHNWQHLLLQQNLAVVSAVHFHPRLDEEQLSAAQFWDSNGHHQRRGERWPTTHQAFRTIFRQQCRFRDTVYSMTEKTISGVCVSPGSEKH